MDWEQCPSAYLPWGIQSRGQKEKESERERVKVKLSLGRSTSSQICEQNRSFVSANQTTHVIVLVDSQVIMSIFFLSASSKIYVCKFIWLKLLGQG